MRDIADKTQHCTKKDLLVREDLVSCRARRVMNKPLVDRQDTLPAAAHHAHLFKRFTKALDKDGGCFTYSCQASPGLTMEKLKSGSFEDSQLSQVIEIKSLKTHWTRRKLEAWRVFVLVMKNPLGSKNARKYLVPVINMLTVLNLRMQHEHQTASLILTNGTVYWESGVNEQRTHGERFD